MGQTHTTEQGPTLEARVAAELRAELGRRGRSRRWLAEATGLPLTSVARWVRGEVTVGLDELDAMARALGTTLPRLLAAAMVGGYAARPVAEDKAAASRQVDGSWAPGLPDRRRRAA